MILVTFLNNLLKQLKEEYAQLKCTLHFSGKDMVASLHDHKQVPSISNQGEKDE